MVFCFLKDINTMVPIILEEDTVFVCGIVDLEEFYLYHRCVAYVFGTIES
tara:strand:+ start:23 stop:172 length:150 start_codon:yes stop_codon:yes gene_type:complete